MAEPYAWVLYNDKYNDEDGGWHVLAYIHCVSCAVLSPFYTVSHVILTWYSWIVYIILRNTVWC